jgi:Na+-driven multidrug efflux pump
MAISAEEPGNRRHKKVLDESRFCRFIDFVHVPIFLLTPFVGQWIVLIAGCNSGLADNVPDFIFGMAIGVGGGSVLSRALGAKKTEKQNHFCQSNYDDLYFMSLFVVYIFSVLKCYFFGAKGEL